MTNTTKPNQYKINDDYLTPRSSHQMRNESSESTANVIPWRIIFACVIVMATLTLSVLLLLGVN